MRNSRPFVNFDPVVATLPNASCTLREGLNAALDKSGHTMPISEEEPVSCLRRRSGPSSLPVIAHTRNDASHDSAPCVTHVEENSDNPHDPTAANGHCGAHRPVLPFVRRGESSFHPERPAPVQDWGTPVMWQSREAADWTAAKFRPLGLPRGRLRSAAAFSERGLGWRRAPPWNGLTNRICPFPWAGTAFLEAIEVQSPQRKSRDSLLSHGFLSAP